MRYIKCPRCDLNYMLETEPYCDVCKSELKIGPQIKFVNLGDDEDQDQILCPICKRNYMDADAEMCDECLEESRDRAVLEPEVNPEDDEEWRNYLDEDEKEAISNKGDNEEEMLSLSQLEEDEAKELFDDEEDESEDDEFYDDAVNDDDDDFEYVDPSEIGEYDEEDEEEDEDEESDEDENV